MGGRKEKTAAGAHRIPAGRFRKDGNVCGTFRGRRRTVLLTKTGPSRYPLRNQRLQRESGERVPCHPEFPRGADQKAGGYPERIPCPNGARGQKGVLHGETRILQRGRPGRCHPCGAVHILHAHLLSGKLSVTFGAGNRAKILEEELIRVNHGLLQGVTILEGDYHQTAKYAGEKTFFYFDPPYKPVNESGGCTSYMPDDFDDNDQIRLAEFCRDLGDAGSK